MTVLWTLADFLEATSGSLVGSVEGDVLDLSIDSRSLEPGHAFFAIKGDRFDGHDFVKAALDNGAAFAVVSRADETTPQPYVLVDDVLRALERLAVAARARSKARIVAVTGSVGKTSTKDGLRLVLSRQGKTHAAVASFNNHWGVPLTLARMPSDTEFGVFEIGMNHSDEIRPLVKMVQPHAAIITTVAPVHLAHFSSVDEIADAKAEIFEGLVSDGVAIINRDNGYFDHLFASARAAGVQRIVSFGRSVDADTRLETIISQGVMSVLDVSVLGSPMHFKLGAPGDHMALNSLAILTAVHVLGADLALAGMALADFTAPKGRGEQHSLTRKGGSMTLIDESYNANPTSVKAAIRLLGSSERGTGGRRIAVLGDMLELGSDSPVFHAGLAEAIEEASVDCVFCSGPDMEHLWKALPETVRGAYAPTSDGLHEPLQNAVGPGDVIMIKGSLGSRMGPLVEMLKKEFGRSTA
ncbi:UDP-N-acetylmuramoylalanyl-D-glutamyl-2,6-diaminopimelate--D-alanyl-D-alanine ligase [Coralliovum pocilloporae]|uniref:UDP-N-acetylmuramoylalanyl-D-glutamyl-2, 6-diaminopimelate--D-alanyl-D-alanine ligase n=1 Tax=Coralliovum pocilloporae TaxID=3066369 RepID=UPI0033074528